MAAGCQRQVVSEINPSTAKTGTYSIDITGVWFAWSITGDGGSGVLQISNRISPAPKKNTVTQPGPIKILPDFMGPAIK